MTAGDLRALVRQQFPAAPGLVIEEAARRLEGRARPNIDAMVAAVARHQFTDYDRFRTTHGLTPEEARACVEGEVRELLEDWRGSRSSHRA